MGSVAAERSARNKEYKNEVLPFSALCGLFPDLCAGQVVRTFQDPSGRTCFISDLIITEKYAYLGSFVAPTLARVPAELLLSES